MANINLNIITPPAFAPQTVAAVGSCFRGSNLTLKYEMRGTYSGARVCWTSYGAPDTQGLASGVAVPANLTDIVLVSEPR